MLTDTWCYPSERYKIAVKLRSYHPARLNVSVRHSDHVVESLDEKTLMPMEFYEANLTASAGRSPGEEIVSITLNPLTFLDATFIPQESYSVTIPVREFPTTIIVRREGRVDGRVNVATTRLPSVRKIAELGVLGDYAGYERELRSIFSPFRLRFGERLERNIILESARLFYTLIHYDGDLRVRGNVESSLPLLIDFVDYFRSHFIYTHEVTALGGLKI